VANLSLFSTILVATFSGSSIVIKITNVNAGVVKYVKAEYPKGFHHLKVEKNELKVAGVYMVSMKYNNQLFHNKIMFIND